MENVADALKMAAAILIFIIAIASSFSLFGTAKQTADSIFGMRDKQAYLEAAELDGGILYTSSSAIQGQTGLTEEQIKDKLGVTTKGDRIVGIDDVISTIYRYTKEKYGVTIVKYTSGEYGEVIARFDSNTESIMRQYNNIKQEELEKYREKLEENTATTYVIPKFTSNKLENLYRITVDGNNGIEYGAPWYGDENEIQKRISIDISGGTYIHNGQIYERKEQDSLYKELKDKKIIEVANEIDQSKYLEDGESSTNLLQQYEMPTIEIVYIVYE